MEQPIETEVNSAHLPSEASGSPSLPALPSRHFVILAPPESESSASDDSGVDEKDIRVFFSDPTTPPFLDTVRRWQDNITATDEPGYISLHDDSDESDFPHSASSRFLSSSLLVVRHTEPMSRWQATQRSMISTTSPLHGKSSTYQLLAPYHTLPLSPDPTSRLRSRPLHRISRTLD